LGCGRGGGPGGNYGGGASLGWDAINGRTQYGGSGAVRVVWGGFGRTFPTTCVGTP
jgi:hypothetical protein